MTGRLFLAVVVSTVAVAAFACPPRSLMLEAEPPISHWEDSILGVDVHVQQNLLVVVTITNKSNATEVVPAPILVADSVYNCFEIRDAGGRLLRTSAPHGDWYVGDRPTVELAPGRSYSEAIDLLRAFPAITRGQFRLRFLYASSPGDKGAWKGHVSLDDISLDIRE